MARTPRVIQTIAALRKAVSTYRKGGDKVALVPTMGALHDGHMSLVEAANKKAGRVIVSIFVNPQQFAPTEDFATYPRTMDTDVARLKRLEVDAVWAPEIAVMYPEGFSTRVAPGGPAYAGLEDAFRPHFFGGVATVVCKLFIQVNPDFAFFGEKDYQQLKVVTRMAADLDLPVQIIGVPTVREPDGLALSSRNVYLSPDERRKAPMLHRVLQDCAGKIQQGHPLDRVMADGGQYLTSEGFVLDYLEARNAETLEPVTSAKQGPLRLLVAARLGTTRLIDNIPV
ncbi:MAG: pantoate--beta-alanine ligase [Pseudorhodoplanes sp.]|jgi:pantoate--beta-alanine ligase|nr:pantoate--beta-alanine ligase [Pseudorhodoplanes sp.]